MDPWSISQFLRTLCCFFFGGGLTWPCGIVGNCAGHNHQVLFYFFHRFPFLLFFYFHFFTLFNFYSYFHFPSWQLWRSQLFHFKPSFLSFLSLYRSFPVCFHLAGILIALLSGFCGILHKTKQCSWIINSFWETDLGSESVQSGCNYLNPEDSQSYLNVGISTNCQFSQSRYKWISHEFVTPIPSIHPLMNCNLWYSGNGNIIQAVQILPRPGTLNDQFI